MVGLVILAFNPGFRIAFGDMGSVPELMVGLDMRFGRLSLSLEMGRVVSGSFVDSSSVATLAEGGGDTVGQNATIYAYSSLMVAGLRFSLLDVSGKRLYVMGGGGFQRPGISGGNYAPAGDDFTYFAGAGGDVLASTFMGKGDFWKRTRFFLELRAFRLKVTDPYASSGYRWANVPDWKVGVLMEF